MIKVEYGKLKTSIEVIEKIIDFDLSIKTAIKLSKITKEISSELEIKDTIHKKIEEKYVPKDENGDVVFSDDDKQSYIPTDPEARIKELVELDNEEIELEFDKIEIDDLGDVKIKTKDIMVIDWLLNIE